MFKFELEKLDRKMNYRFIQPVVEAGKKNRSTRGAGFNLYLRTEGELRRQDKNLPYDGAKPDPDD